MKQEDVRELFHSMRDYVKSLSDGGNGAHTAAIALVSLADAMIDTWLFKSLDGATISPNSWERAKQMASDILMNQVESNTMDVNENATQFIVDWVLSNKAYFGPNTVGTCLGFTSDTGNTAYIFPSMLNQALSKAGYSPRKTMKYLAEQGLIGTYTESTGKKTYSVMRRFDNRNCRFVEFHIDKFSEKKDVIDDMEDFIEIDSDIEDLPFDISPDTR